MRTARFGVYAHLRLAAMLEHWSASGRTVLEHAEGHVPPSLAASAEVVAGLREAIAQQIS